MAAGEADRRTARSVPRLLVAAAIGFAVGVVGAAGWLHRPPPSATTASDLAPPSLAGLSLSPAEAGILFRIHWLLKEQGVPVAGEERFLRDVVAPVLTAAGGPESRVKALRQLGIDMGLKPPLAPGDEIVSVAAPTPAPFAPAPAYGAPPAPAAPGAAAPAPASVPPASEACGGAGGCG